MIPVRDNYAMRAMRGRLGSIAIVLGLIAFLTLVGVLAAVAIPAYQDYTIRAQVAEAANLALPLQEAVAQWASRHEQWPDDISELDQRPVVTGRYVTDMRVSGGTVTLVFGGAAHRAIQGQSLSFQPFMDAEGAIRWRCGRAVAPANIEQEEEVSPPDSGADNVQSGTTIPDRYLPSSCR